MKKGLIFISFGLVVLAVTVLYIAFREESYGIAGESQTEIVESYSFVNKSRYAVPINEASYEELLGVKNMNERMANGIIRYRKEHGRIISESDLLKVEGFGPVSLQKVLPYITLE